MRVMKDSGIEWIRQIPNKWTLKRIKFLADSSTTDSFTDGDWIEAPFIEQDGIRYLTTGNIGDGEFKRQGDGYISEETFNLLKCKFVYPGDLIISRLNQPFGRSCILPDDEDRYIVAVDNVILRTKENKQFICYITQCEGFHQVVGEDSRGTAMQRISRTNLGKIKIPIPPLPEQSRIAAFLDERCGKIDEAIARHKALIEKLDEYRKAVITKAVTKGVRGKREMKESGVDWIGQMPKEWSIIKGRYVYSVLSGFPLDSEKFSMTDGFPMIRIRDITSGVIETYYNGDFPVQYVVTKGELLIGMDGDFRVRQWDNINAVLNQRCCKITEHKYVIRRFLFYVLPLYLKRINDVIFGTTVKHLSVPDMKVAPIPIPSLEEQAEIVAYLDKKCAAINSAKDRHQQLITKLEEYKKSLIYNAVTGKIEC